MARPRKADRDDVKSVVITVKFTPADRAMLGRLVKKHADDFERATGQRLDATASGYIRWLLAREGKSQGRLRGFLVARLD